MFQFIPVFDGNTIAVRASGKLSHEDYQTFLPQLEEQISQLGKISLLLELDNFSGWDLKAAEDDYKFGMKHLDDLERIAIVGDQAWEHWMALMAKPFMPSGKVRYFNREDLQDAWDWLREKQALEIVASELLPYKNILVAIDFSVYSKHAAIRAIELAKYYKANLTLLHVVQEKTNYNSYYSGSMSGYPYDPMLEIEQDRQLLIEAEKQMKVFTDDLNTDIEIHTNVISGHTGATILSFLEAQNTDLAVFGAKKKKGFSKLLGSTPHYIQNHARCETLVVPLQDDSSTFEKD